MYCFGPLSPSLTRVLALSFFSTDVTFNVYSDFDEHWGKRTNATYIREKGTGFKGIHSVKMVGFGTGSDGVDYCFSLA